MGSKKGERFGGNRVRRLEGSDRDKVRVWGLEGVVEMGMELEMGWGATCGLKLEGGGVVEWKWD